MTQEVLKQMYQLLLTEPHAPTVCAQLERIAREALAEHAMRETQRLGQEIEQEPVAYDKTEMNCFVQDLYDKKMKEGKHGHYETMFHVVHQAIKRVAPPQRTWVGLTKEQISEFDTWHDNREEEVGWVNPSEIVAYIDAKLKQKNGYAEEKNT